MTDASLPPPILRARQLAELLGVHRSTLWRWEQAGAFPLRRSFGPNTVGWLVSEIEVWLHSAPVAKERARGGASRTASPR